MKIKFIGVGEAFDENHANSCIFIEDAGILLDCGFSAVQSLWREGVYERICAIFISHFHGDHTLGIPGLLMRYMEEGRKEPILVIGAKGVEKNVRMMMDAAYHGFFDKLGFDVLFHEIDSDSKMNSGKTKLSFAKAEHADSSYAVRVNCGLKSVVYSGDTGYCADVADLARNCDLLIHEAYTFQKIKEERDLVSHSSFLSCGLCAANSGAKGLALVHVSRDSRNDALIREEVKQVYRGKVIIPKDGDVVEV